MTDPGDHGETFRKLAAARPDLAQALLAVHGRAPESDYRIDVMKVCFDTLAQADAINSSVDRRLPALLDAPPERQQLFFQNSDERVKRALLYALVQEADGLRLDDPHQAYRLIQDAHRLLTYLAATKPYEGYNADIEARVNYHRAAFLRTRSNLPDARAAFDEAHAALKRGTGDPLDTAEYNALRSNFEVDLGNFESALTKLNYALRVFRRFQHKRLPDVLLMRALVYIELENYTDAIADLRAAMSLTSDPRLILFTAHNRGLALERSGQALDALKHMHQISTLYRGPGATPMIRLQRDWLLGRIHAALGHYAEARTCLTTARQGFLQSGLFFECGQCGLDLAAVALSLGDHQRAATLAAELYAFAVANQLPREAIAAYLMVSEAAQAADALSATILLASRSLRRLRAPRATTPDPQG